MRRIANRKSRWNIPSGFSAKYRSIYEEKIMMALFLSLRAAGCTAAFAKEKEGGEKNI